MFSFCPVHVRLDKGEARKLRKEGKRETLGKPAFSNQGSLVGQKLSFLLFLRFVNVYLFLRERERQSASGGEAERMRHRIQSRLQALSCQREPNMRLELMNEIMTSAKVRCLTD